MNSTRGRDQLLELLKKHTQEALAADLEVSQQSVSDWKLGHTKPRGQSLAKLQKNYGIEIDAWFVDTTTRADQPRARRRPATKRATHTAPKPHRAAS